MRHYETIDLLTVFRRALLRWFDGQYDPEGKEGLRAAINRLASPARSAVIEAGCLQLLTVGPPPAVGGLVIQNADPFGMLFESLWGRSIIPTVTDMCDQAIGVLEHHMTRLTRKELLDELRHLFAQRDGLDDESGRQWLARIGALIRSVDADRAELIEQQTPIFDMPVSTDLRNTAWQTVLQQIRSVISTLEVGGYGPDAQEEGSDTEAGGRIFIGHGRSSEWLKLKDFLAGRLDLEYEEFNREPTAGYTTKERLEAMLASSSFAFLVMTGEEIDPEGQMHARENVVHEVGLFQGRRGFARAIVLLEEGCQEFSNIHGLVQIRFPKGNILAVSEEVRRVLEREGILEK